MKRILFILLVGASIAGALTSCLNGDMQSTPELYATQMYRIHGEQQDTIRPTDSISIGDTLCMPVLISGQFNCLKSFAIQAQPAVFDYWMTCDSTVLEVLTEATRLDQGLLYFLPKMVVVAQANVWFVPKQSGQQPMYFNVTNDATDEKYCTRGFSVTFTIR